MLPEVGDEPLIRNVALRVYENGKKIYQDFGEMLFTHFGVSGPMILSASAHMRHFGKKSYRLGVPARGPESPGRPAVSAVFPVPR